MKISANENMIQKLGKIVDYLLSSFEWILSSVLFPKYLNIVIYAHV